MSSRYDNFAPLEVAAVDHSPALSSCFVCSWEDFMLTPEKNNAPGDLFGELPVSLSPRMKWMRRKGVVTQEAVNAEGQRYYMAWTTLESVQQPTIGRGKEEDDALVQLAVKMGWRLWNEEGAVYDDQ